MPKSVYPPRKLGCCVWKASDCLPEAVERAAKLDRRYSDVDDCESKPVDGCEWGSYVIDEMLLALF